MWRKISKGVEGTSCTHIFIVEFQSKPSDDADGAGCNQSALLVRVTLRGRLTEVRLGATRVPEPVIRITGEIVMEPPRARDVVE